MNTKNDSSKKTLRLVLIFMAFICALLIGSATYKFLILVEKSAFDGDSQFHLAVWDKQKKESIEMLAFVPKKQEIIIVQISGKMNKSIPQTLKIPVDGSIEFQNKILSFDETLEKQLEHIIFHWNSVETQLTFVDALRLYFFARSVPTANRGKEAVNYNSEDILMDRKITSLFSDDEMVKERQSIQIINATDMSGKGTRLARLVSNMGGNVVDVATAATATSSSSISYFGKSGYTVKRLTHALGMPSTEQPTNGISDIVITIGTDHSDSLAF